VRGLRLKYELVQVCASMSRLAPLAASAIALLLLLPTIALAANVMPIELDTGRDFHAFVGDNIQWWQGGATLIYNLPSDVAKEKISSLLRHVSDLFQEYGFIVIAGSVRAKSVLVTMAFDGVVEYEGLYFADDNGTIIIQWSENNPLVITILSKVVVNASTAKYAGKSSIETVKVNGGVGYPWLKPRLSIPASGDSIQVLIVPIGEPEKMLVVDNYYHNETKTCYLGATPSLYRLKPWSLGYTLTEEHVFWCRVPALKIIYDDSGRHVFIYDWFWHTDIPVEN